MATDNPGTLPGGVDKSFTASTRPGIDTNGKQLQRLLSRSNDNDKRQFPRKPYQLLVDYAAKDKVFRDFIQNISGSGVFIETRRKFPVGQGLSMTFSLPSSQRPVKFSGNIVRRTREGIGVQFTA